MFNTIETSKLKEHHKNGYYFTDIEGEKYEEVKRSIEAQGIRDPIKCTRDYTVISGHQRLRIARDLGLEKVPYQMLDVDEDEAEYLLIAENVERRGQAEIDPIKKSRIANFLKEYWGVRQGKKGQNVLIKTTEDIGEFIGTDERTTKRILKLHDLIPQLQRLISAGKLGTTAGEQLAYLSPEVQTALYETLGDEITSKTVKETQELRRQVDGMSSKETTDFLKRENERLKKELREKDTELLRAKTPKVEIKEVVKEVVPEEVTRKYEQAQQEKRQLEHSLMRTYERIEELEKIEKSVRTQEESPLYDIIRSLQTVNRNVDSFTISPRRAESIIDSASDDVVGKLETEIRRAVSKMEGLLGSIDKRNGVIVVDTENTINTMEVINYD